MFRAAWARLQTHRSANAFERLFSGESVADRDRRLLAALSPSLRTGCSRPSRDIALAPKETFRIEEADFEPATSSPDRAPALRAWSASCISPLRRHAGSLFAHGMPEWRSHLRSGVCICSPPMTAEDLCMAAGGLRVHGSCRGRRGTDPFMAGINTRRGVLAPRAFRRLIPYEETPARWAHASRGKRAAVD